MYLYVEDVRNSVSCGIFVLHTHPFPTSEFYLTRYQVAGRLWCVFLSFGASPTSFTQPPRSPLFSDVLNSIISVGQLPPVTEDSLLLKNYLHSVTRSFHLSPEDQELQNFEQYPSGKGTGSESQQQQVGSSDLTHNNPFVLPYHSHELGTLPLHSSGVNGTSDAVDLYTAFLQDTDAVVGEGQGLHDDVIDLGFQYVRLTLCIRYRH